MMMMHDGDDAFILCFIYYQIAAQAKCFLRMMLIIIELIFFDRLFSIIGTFFQNRDQIETNFSHFPEKVSIRDHG